MEANKWVLLSGVPSMVENVKNCLGRTEVLSGFIKKQGDSLI